MKRDPTSAAGGDTFTCGLCGRQVPARLMTLHHLTPKQKGGKAEHRTPLCKPCHKQLHATFSNTELARTYPSLEALREAATLQPFLAWIRRQSPDRNFRTIDSNTRSGRRRKR